MSEVERAWAATRAHAARTIAKTFKVPVKLVTARSLGDREYDRAKAAKNESVVERLGKRKGLCHFCDHPQVYEVTYDVLVRCAHSPVGVCAMHVRKGVDYVASCPDAGDYVLVGRLP